MDGYDDRQRFEMDLRDWWIASELTAPKTQMTKRLMRKEINRAMAGREEERYCQLVLLKLALPAHV